LVLALALMLSAGAVTACESGRHNIDHGNATEDKGKFEKAVGDVTGNDDKKAEGQRDEDKGKTQKAVGQVQEKVDVTVDKTTNP
jgi:uncharacterized protein YjbJ (UPF0337 family)